MLARSSAPRPKEKMKMLKEAAPPLASVPAKRRAPEEDFDTLLALEAPAKKRVRVHEQLPSSSSSTAFAVGAEELVTVTDGRLEASSNQIKASSDNIKASSDQIKASSNQIEALKAELESSRAGLKLVRETLAARDNKIAALEQSEKALQTTIASDKTKIVELEKTLESTVASTKIKVEDLESTLQTTFDDGKVKIEDLNTTLQATFDDGRVQIEALTEERDELAAIARDWEGAARTIAAQRDEEKANVRRALALADHHAEQTQAEKAMNLALARDKAHEKHAADVMGQALREQKELRQMERAGAAALDKELEEEKTKVRSLQATADALAKEKDAETVKVQTLQATAEALAKEKEVEILKVQNLQATAQALAKEKDEEKAKVENLQSTIHAITKEKDYALAQVQTFKTAGLGVEKQRDDANLQLVLMKQQGQSIQTDLSTSKGNEASLQSTIRELEKQLAAATDSEQQFLSAATGEITSLQAQLAEERKARTKAVHDAAVAIEAKQQGEAIVQQQTRKLEQDRQRAQADKARVVQLRVDLDRKQKKIEKRAADVDRLTRSIGHCPTMTPAEIWGAAMSWMEHTHVKQKLQASKGPAAAQAADEAGNRTSQPVNMLLNRKSIASNASSAGSNSKPVSVLGTSGLHGVQRGKVGKYTNNRRGAGLTGFPRLPQRKTQVSAAVTEEDMEKMTDAAESMGLDQSGQGKTAGGEADQMESDEVEVKVKVEGDEVKMESEEEEL